MKQLQLNWYGFHEWERAVARVVSLGWGVFWAWFGFASGVAEYASVADIFLQTLPGLIFIAVSLLAWRHPAPGGTLLVALAIVVFTAYWAGAENGPAAQGLATGLLLALPPLTSGVLFLASAPSDDSRHRMDSGHAW
ncbi:MAG: DUF7670 domain-containing protein [Bryobacteraceae bacterium]